MLRRLWGPAFWTLAGNATANFAQWAVIVVLSRLLGYKAGGDYALALAVVNPVLMFTNLQLRAVQASDAAGRFRFRDYLSLRLWTSLAACVLIIEFGTLASAPVTVLLAVLGLKLVEGISDIYHGAFQQVGRMDWIAQSQMARSVLLLALMIIGAAFSRPLSVTLAGAAVGSALVLGWFDCAQARRLRLEGVGRLLPDWPIRWPALRPLLETAFPLGVVMMLISLNQSIPRFAIERYAGREALGTFAAIAALAQVVNLALNAIGQSLTTPLARLAHERDAKAFRALFGRAFLIGAGIVAVLTMACVGFSSTALELIFGQSTTDQSWWLTLQLAAGGVTALAGLCGYALTALGDYRTQLLLFLPLTGITAAAAGVLVPAHGIDGACWVGIATAVLHLAAAGFLVNLRMLQLGGVNTPLPAAELAK